MPFSRDLPGIEPRSPTLQVDSLPDGSPIGAREQKRNLSAFEEFNKLCRWN